MELYIDVGDGGKNKAAFDTLESRRDEIQIEMGTDLSWERLNDARASRIAMYNSGSIDYSPEDLQALSEWAISGILKFREVFRDRIKQL